MATKMQGADPAALDALASEVTEAAARLRMAQRVINGPLHLAPWFGGYAGLFRSKWDDQLTGSLYRSADFLDSAATGLRRQAAEQRRASEAASGGPPQICIPYKDKPAGDDDEQSVRDFLASVGLTVEQINDLLKKFGKMLGLLNKILDNDALKDFITTLGTVTDVLGVVTNFFDDLAQNADLPFDEALVHALGETAMRFVASEGGQWVGQVLTTALMTAIAPGVGTAAGWALGKAVGFIVDKVVEAGMDAVDDQFNVYDGTGDLAVDAYRFAKERDFDGVRILRDAAGEGLKDLGNGLKDGAENIAGWLDPFD